MRNDPMFRDVTSDSQLKGLQAPLKIDRDRANTLGVSIDAIRSALFSAFGERQVSTTYTAADKYQVIMEASPDDKQDESAFNDIFVRSSTGALVPISSFTTVERTVGPTSINHVGQLQAVTVSFNLASGTALGDATAKIEQSGEQIRLATSVIASYSGDAAVFKSSQGSQLVLIVGALLVIYVLLGALLMLKLFNQDLTLIATIGIFLLIGIVKKNAIMMIDFALDAQRAPGRHIASGHPRGLRSAFPPDHGDHAGGVDGCVADRAGFGRRRRVAPTLWLGRGGWADLLAG